MLRSCSSLNFCIYVLFICGLTLFQGVQAQTDVSQKHAILPYPVPPPGITVLNDVVIGKGGTLDLHAEIAYPSNAPDLLTAVIYIHGGAWMVGSYKNQNIFKLAKAGFFAASMEYRLSDVAKWPAQIQDCKLGVRWLRAHATQYHIDPKHIGVWGESAGGHLAACLGTMTDIKDYEGSGGYAGVSSSVQAVVDYYGPTDFIEYTKPTYSNPWQIGVLKNLLGFPYEKDRELWKKASPRYYVKPGDPPVLLVQGDSDKVVPLVQSTLFDQALTQAGVPHQLIVVNNAEHGFSALPGKEIVPNRTQIHQAMLDFFSKYLKSR